MKILRYIKPARRRFWCDLFLLMGLALVIAPFTLLPLAAGTRDACAPLPVPEGRIVRVSTEDELWRAVAAKIPGTTILIADGTYNMARLARQNHFLWIDTPDTVLRSASGNRDAVVLDGGYVAREIISIAASNVTIADLTIRRARHHSIHVMSSDKGDTQNTLIHNVRILDPGEQAIKINPHQAKIHFPDKGVIACSRIELTREGRSNILKFNRKCYTGGIDAHQARDWIVRDNVIKGFWCPAGLAEHAVHFWTGSRDTLVERNTITDNARGIGFGLLERGAARSYADNPCPRARGGYVGHYGGVIRNNRISATQKELFASKAGFDSGISLAQACGARVENNIVVSSKPPFSSIEWRFANTHAVLIGNHVSHNLRRRGGKAVLKGNRENVPPSRLKTSSAGFSGKLNLKSSAAGEKRKQPANTPVRTVTPAGSKPKAQTKVQPGDFQYLGAFRLPGGDARPKTFDYGGNAMTFSPDGDVSGAKDDFTGSLFIMGHDRLAYGELPDGNQVAEISIPAPVISKNVKNLNRAKFLQGFHDVTKRRFRQYEEIPHIGMHYLNAPATGPKIHIGWVGHLQPDTPTATNGWFSPNLSAPNFQGNWFIGAQSNESLNEYLFGIPLAWAGAHTRGRMLATGRFRDGGRGGMGPVLIAYKPWSGKTGIPASANMHLKESVLLLYGKIQNTGTVKPSLKGYQHADEWTGGAWLTTRSGKTAVLFAGTKSTGAKYWYGFINPKGPEHPCVQGAAVGQFTVCRLANGKPCPPVDLKECAGHNGMRGWWSAGMSGQFLLYDPDDLANVAEGRLKPWQPQPYGIVNIDHHLLLNPPPEETAMLGSGVQRRYRIGAIAYDWRNDLLYVLEQFADGSKPVVHVWRIN